MNTPDPCCYCQHLYCDPIHKDDPTYTCQCWLGKTVQEGGCSSYLPNPKETSPGAKKVPRLSTGEPSTLGTYLRMAKAVAPGSKFEKFIQDKINQSSNGKREIVIAAETQMLYLLGQMLDPVEKEE